MAGRRVKEVVSQLCRSSLCRSDLRHLLLLSIERTAPPELHEWFIPDFQVGQKRRIFDSTYTSSRALTVPMLFRESADTTALKTVDQKRITFYPESLQEIKEQSVVRQNGEEIPADIM